MGAIEELRGRQLAIGNYTVGNTSTLMRFFKPDSVQTQVSRLLTSIINAGEGKPENQGIGLGYTHKCQ